MTGVADYLNQLDASARRAALQKCCGADAWVKRMEHHVPFENDRQVEMLACRIWWELDPSDWRVAFAAHPRIGDLTALRTKFANTEAWARSEQAGVTASHASTLQRLAAGNDQYFAKFGYIFIICATGKSAAEMLTTLEERMQNDPTTELRLAAEEQNKIIHLRLEKLVLGPT